MVDYFERHIGESLNEPIGEYFKASENHLIFARNSSASEKIIFSKEFNIHSTHTLSTLIMPANGERSQDGTYVRFEGYSLMLANAKNGANLTSLYFNLEGDFEKLAKINLENFDLLELFAMEVKVFFNSAMDYWRMDLDIDELVRKYHKQRGIWCLEPGTKKQRTKIPLHIGERRLYLIL